MWSGQINRIMHTLRCFLLYEDKLVPVTNDLEELYQLVMAGNHPRKDKTTVIMEQYRANIKFAMSAGLPLQKFFFHALTFFDPAMTIDTLKILWQGNSYWRTHAYSTEGTESESLAAFIKHVGDFKF